MIQEVQAQRWKNPGISSGILPAEMLQMMEKFPKDIHR